MFVWLLGCLLVHVACPQRSEEEETKKTRQRHRSESSCPHPKTFGLSVISLNMLLNPVNCVPIKKMFNIFNSLNLLDNNDMGKAH